MALLQESLAERIIRERKFIWQEHYNWEPLWQEISELIAPGRGDVIVHNNAGSQKTRRLFDSTALVASTRLAAAISGVVTPSMTQWFDFELPRVPGLTLPKQVGDWTQHTAETMFDIMQQTNFDSEIQKLFYDLVTNGTGCMFVINEDGMPSYRTLHISEYAIWTDSNGRVVKLVRDIQMTIREAIKTFGFENLSPEMQQRISENKETIDDKHTFVQWLAMRDDEVLGFPVDNFPVASIYVDVDATHIVKRSGFHEWPCPVVRWAVGSGEAYGYSPSFTSLPDVASLNKAEEYGLRAWAMSVIPPLLAINDGVLGKPDLRPSRMTMVNQEGALKWFPPGTDLNIETVSREDKRKSIWNIFFMDQVQFIPERGKTPASAEEVRARLNIMLQILGPTLSRLEYEFLIPMLGRTHGILDRAGKLPPPPSSAFEYAEQSGSSLSVQFIGPLARAKRTAESQKLDLALQSLAIAQEVDPNVKDNVSLDEWIREKYRIEMMPAALLRARKEVQALRQARAEQMREQQEAQMQLMAAQAGNQLAPLVKEANNNGG